MQDASRIDQNAQGRIAHCDNAYTGTTSVLRGRLNRLTGVIAACFWACTSASGLQAGETIVRLYPSAVVSADEVTLADIAEVHGESADLAARIELGGAPHVGQSGNVDVAHVQAILSRRGVNLSNWVFRGASRCAIRRVGRTPSHPQPGGRSEHSTESNATTRPDALNNGSQLPPSQAGTQTTGPIDANTLEGVLRSYLSNRLADIGGTPVIHFSPAALRVLSFSKPNYDFRISNRSDRLLGMVALEVNILEAGQVKQTVPVLADVALDKSVIVATRPINRGEILKPDQLATEERTFDRVEEIGVGDPASLIGQRAKRFIENHAIVYVKDIEPMPLILANDLVTVTAKRGALRIRGSAKALAQAGLGESIKLRNEMSKEVFTAVVTGLRTAEVCDASAEKGTAVVDAVARASIKTMPEVKR